MTPRTIAAIPCYNTAGHIGEVVTEARRHVDEVVVVDDGSLDGTAEEARRAGARVVVHSRNTGYGAAIQTCFRAARELGAEVTVILDGDGQHRAADIPLICGPVLTGEADCVIGSRFINPCPEMPAYRRFGIRVITMLNNVCYSTNIKDAQSGYRAYSRRLVESLDLRDQDMGVSVEILAQIRRHGYRVLEKPITCHYAPSKLSPGAVIHAGKVILATLRTTMLARGNHRRQRVSGVEVNPVRQTDKLA